MDGEIADAIYSILDEVKLFADTIRLATGIQDTDYFKNWDMDLVGLSAEDTTPCAYSEEVDAWVFVAVLGEKPDETCPIAFYDAQDQVIK